MRKLKFTPNDILVKRDIDFINSIKYPENTKIEINFGMIIQEKKKQT